MKANSTTYNNLIEVQVTPATYGAGIIQAVGRYKPNMPGSYIHILVYQKPYRKFIETGEEWLEVYERVHYIQ